MEKLNTTPMRRTTPYYIYSAALTLMLALALTACGHGHQQRLLQLEELERQNRADSLMTNDSLALALAHYFDRHGTPNEQMRAHYMLGRTYYDRGELPQALDAYHEAAARADTTAQDCDYRTLCRVHAQTAQLFYSQYLPTSQIPLERNAAYYAQKANDTLSYIASISMEAEAYSLLENTDSALILFENAFNMYMQKQLTSMAANLCCSMAELYCKKAEFQTAKRYLDIYERKSDYFDNNGNVESGKEIYYYIKGLYYLEIGRLDSAEYFFRKELTVSTDFVNQFAARKGLLSLYVHKSNTDSIRKYMALADSLSDSSHLYLEMQASLHLKSLYDYSRQQELAQVEKSRADRNEKHFWIAGFFLLLTSFLTTAACHSYYRLSKKKKEREAEYQELKSRHQQICEELSNLYRLNQYQPPLPTVEQSQEETSSLRNREKELERMISKKQQEANELQKKLYAYEQEFEARKVKVSNIMNQLKDTPIHKAIQTKANKCELLTEEEWSEFETALEHVDSQFFSLVSAKRNEMSMSEYHVCLLSRIGIKPSLAGNMIGVKPAYVSDMRRHLLKILFGIDGSAKQLDSLMRQVC